MAEDGAPLLHRDDPDRAALPGHTKVTAEDWIAMARDTLVRGGVEQVKILTLADRMEVSRSSFYWYFKNRDELLAALLSEWEARNTARIVAHCRMPSDDIGAAVLNFFRCFVNPAHFDRGLDFAVREWARRDEDLRTRVDAADRTRLEAVTDMFARHGYAPEDADARARILYYMQLGYHALDVREPMSLRMSRIRPYLRGFTGRDVSEDAVRVFIGEIEALGLA